MLRLATALLQLGRDRFVTKYGISKLKEVREFIKKGTIKLVGTGKNKKYVKVKKADIKKVRPTNKKTTKKSTKNQNQKPDKDFFAKAGIKKPVSGGGSTALVKYNPRKIAIIKAKPKNKLTKADKALLAAATTVPFLAGPSKKKTETKKTGRTTSPSSFIASKTKGVTMDDMLVKKDVKGPSKKFLQKTSKPKGKGQFGANISFASSDVKTLRQNAKDLKKQIDGLDITNFQKLRLKKLVDTRDKNFSMGESYRKAFSEVKRRVKDNKLNFAIDVSGYAG